MKLSNLEFIVMNNPIRRWFQKRLELRVFKQHLNKYNIDLNDKVILDIGCGSGYSTELISKEFAPSRLFAFDYMPEQVELAKKRGVNSAFFVGDATEIDLDSNTFDAAFVFGVLHHIPGWKKAIREIARILKSDGVLLIEEPRECFINFADFLGFYHPKAARFSWQEFEKELELGGFKILTKKTFLVGTFRSYLCLNQKNL